MVLDLQKEELDLQKKELDKQKKELDLQKKELDKQKKELDLQKEELKNDLTYQMFKEFVEITKSNPFEGGTPVWIDKNGHYLVTETPDGCNGFKTTLTTSEQFINLWIQSREIIRERMKVNQQVFIPRERLPQSRDVFCGDIIHEGATTNNSLEGGTVFILGLRKTNINFALNKETIPRVGVPTTIFIVRTEKVIRSASDESSMDNAIDSSREYHEVKAMFVACVKGDGSRLDDDTPMYYYPFSNSNSGNFGRVCLGSVFGSDLLLFEKAIHLDRLPIEFYNAMASTHELQVNYRSKNEVSYKQFLINSINKPFDENELIPMNMTYKQFLDGATSTLYR